MASNHRVVCARAARQEFKEAYCRGIGDYRNARLLAHFLGRHLQQQLPDELPMAPLAQVHGEDLAQFAWDGSIACANAEARELQWSFRVMARKRPLLHGEVEAGGYDSVSVEGRNNSVITHDGRVHRDGRTLYMVHSRFCVDRFFGEAEDNDCVYEETAKPLLHKALQGGRATLMMFGQTGTGKTYTAKGILSSLCEELFADCHRHDPEEGELEVTVLAYELAGSRGGREAWFDLLAERKQVKCLTGGDGEVHIRGAKEIVCRSAAELVEAIGIAFSWRSSESTERNEASSRSHAAVELQLRRSRPATAAAQEAATEESDSAVPRCGVLRIVDLAGSERNYETQQHTRSMAERGGLVNFSLLMLKECARIMHRNRQLKEDGKDEQHVPFRRSSLTHLLSSCFKDEAHETVVVGTLSPSPTDVEHSLNTLQHVAMMRSSRSWELGLQKGQAASSSAGAGGPGGFSEVAGRGHGLHSKLQDARVTQLKLHAFDMVTVVGGTIQKKYDAASLKTEAFIDPRWHREMKVEVDGNDLWVLREADAEVVQVLNSWREEQWKARKVHDLVRWDAATVSAFVSSLQLPGEVRLPTTMTGAQLRRLGRRGLTSLCSDEATAEALHLALQGEKDANNGAAASQRASNAKITALGTNKVHVALAGGSGTSSSDAGSTVPEPVSAVSGGA